MGGTYQDPSGGNAREQSFAPRSRGGGFNRGMARGHRNLKPFVPYDTCARCGEKGHCRNECPHERYRPPSPRKQSVPTDVSKSEVNQNGVHYLYGKGIPHTYEEVELKGRKIPDMFDTGCEVSCPYKFRKNAKLYPTDVKLFAANDSEIKVLGKMHLMFSFGVVPTSADLIVTDELTEFLLGMDFTCANDCEWLVSKGRILIRGRSVPLVKCPRKAYVRCVIVRDLIVVPADFVMTVPVKMPLMHPKMSDSDWISEAKELRPGLSVARMLLSRSSNFSAVAMLNVSGKDQTLPHDTYIGVATPC